MATQGVDNVDNQKQIVHMIHMAILLCASAEVSPGQFVDNVDYVDARFKLVADEVSCLRDTMLYKYIYFNLLSFFYYPHCPQHFADCAVVGFACGQSIVKT